MEYKKRYDFDGRVLREGEGQRKDGRYYYRYTDATGKRNSVYARTLDELRKKEMTVCPSNNPQYAEAHLTVSELLRRYLSTKRDLKKSTEYSYNSVLKKVEADEFGQREVKSIKTSDAKAWMIKLHDSGLMYGTVSVYKNVLKPAFQMAYEDDIIQKNPFDFKLSSILKNDKIEREALTKAQQEAFLDFLWHDRTYNRYYDEVVLLLNTGMRVSEFCGLTMNDVDFESRRIHIDHQIVRDSRTRARIESPKTPQSYRYIPLNQAAYNALVNIIKHRPKCKVEMIVDGYSGFLFITANGTPMMANDIEDMLRAATQKFNKKHPDKAMPNITPHILRHTFCTNMVYAGMDIKALQYIMGHSNPEMTLDVYAHTNYDMVAEKMRKIDGTNIGVDTKAEMRKV